MKRKLVRIAWQKGAGEWHQSEFEPILSSTMKNLERLDIGRKYRIESKTIEVKGYGKRL